MVGSKVPLSKEVRRLGRSWGELKSGVAAFAETIPAGGISVAEFEHECLGEVFAPDRPAIVRALRSAHVIWMARRNNTLFVFGSKPEDRWRSASEDPLGNTFLRAVVPLMSQLTAIVEIEADYFDRETSVALKDARARITAVIRQHKARGVTIDHIRFLLWRTFKAEAVGALADHEPLLAREAPDEIKRVRPARSARLPAGLEPDERILALVAKAGPEGILVKEIVSGFPSPRPPSEYVKQVLAQAIEDGIIRSAVVKLTRMGRPGVRYYGWHQPIPKMSNGVVVQSV